MADQADSTSTPSAQQQHNPPSLPTSPHPKRVKTDDLLNDSATGPPTTSANTQPTATDSASTPTPSQPTTNPPTFDPSSLPPVSSLLPSLSDNPSLPMPPMMSNGDGNNIMNTSSLADGPMPPMQMQPMAPFMGGAPIVPLPSAAPPPLMVKKLVPEATVPTRGSAFAAGYDLYASAPFSLKAKSKGLVSTGIAIATPAGTYGRVAPRSGLASKHFLDTGAGVIDADYRGEVKVLMFNFSDVDYEIKQGERIAQLVLERIMTPEVLEVQELEESVRGAGGFGSTGYI